MEMESGATVGVEDDAKKWLEGIKFLIYSAFCKRDISRFIDQALVDSLTKHE